MSLTKIVYLVDKRPELSDAEFVRHWTTMHAGLAQHDARRLELLDQLAVASCSGARVRSTGTRCSGSRAAMTAKAAWATPAGVATAD